MSHKTNILPRLDGESLTDWTLRFLADGRRRIQFGQELCKQCDGSGFVFGQDNRLQACALCTQRECTCENNGDYCDYCESQRADADRRRLNDLYRACTPVEAEFAEGEE